MTRIKSSPPIPVGNQRFFLYDDTYKYNNNHMSSMQNKLEQLERLRSEDTPRRPV